MPTNPIWAALAAEFSKDMERTYQGRGSRTFTYIEPRDVMQRLDDVLTPAGWQFECAAVSDHVAHGRLRINVEGEWIAREDFGYPNNSGSDSELLKEAQSDALRRCAMAFGVARYLYRRDVPGQSAQRPAQAPRTAPAPRKAPDEIVRPLDVPDEPPFPGFDAVPQAIAAFGDLIVDESHCPDHDKAWRQNSKGYYCSTKVGDGWCKRQPSKGWQAAQELIPA